jgi:hypothetical protein
MSRQEAASKPLAAYRLGLLSRMLRVHQNLFDEFPEFEYGTAEGVCFAFEQLTQALVALVSEVPVNAYAELRKLLQVQSERWDRVGIMVWKHSLGEAWDEKVVAEARQELDVDLSALADSAMENSAGLKCWYDLGREVGEYQARLKAHDGGPLPGIDGLLAAIQGTGQADQALSRIVELGKKERDPRTLLTRALLTPGDAQDMEAFSPEFDGYVVNRLLLKLDAAVQDSLEGIEVAKPATEVVPSTVQALKPVWDKNSGELRWNGVVVRKLVPRAKNVIRILDAFEQRAWPGKIQNPLASRDTSIDRKYLDHGNALRLHETIKSLNTGLQAIRFHSDGQGEGITWRPTGG